MAEGLSEALFKQFSWLSQHTVYHCAIKLFYAKYSMCVGRRRLIVNLMGSYDQRSPTAMQTAGSTSVFV